MTTTSPSDRFSPEYRRAHLGASQWPAACGLDPYREPIDLFAEITGLREWDSEPSEAIELGHALEDGVAKVAARKLGRTAFPSPTLEHPHHPWACATPDRVLDDGTLLQVKTTRLISDFTYVEEWGEPGSDEVPARVLAQVTGEMVIYRARVAPVEVCHVAALIAGRGVCLYEVPFDRDLAEMLWDRVVGFWGHVQRKEPPPPDDTESFTKFLAQRYPRAEDGKWVEADAAITDNALHLKKVRAQLDELEKEERTARNQICARIADAQGVRGPWGKISWSAVKGREGLDTDTFLLALKQKFGADAIDTLVKQFTKRGNGYRAFRPSWAKEGK